MENNEHNVNADLSADDHQRLSEKVIEMNDLLVTKSIDVAGQAFTNAYKLGCAIMFLPVVIIMVVSYFLDKFSLISIFIYGGLGVMLATVFGSIIANRAKTLAILDDDGVDINTQIQDMLAGTEFSPAQFEALAHDLLGENAPLRVHLLKPVSEEEENE